MRLVVLGCGTSTGVPVIGCHCGVCSSVEPFNKRTRSSLLVRSGGSNVLIDTSTDLRAQSLANGVERIDAVLFTHPHADHIHGIDELRAFNMVQGASIPCYANEYTIERIRVMFDYIFSNTGNESWRPQLTTSTVTGPFELYGMRVVPIEIRHGSAAILGYRIGDVAYVTDCSSMPPQSMEKLRGLEVLILGALRYKPHPTHLSIREALDIVAEIKPKRTLLTHLSHSLDYRVANSELPEGVELAYDGMVIEARG